jgi:hypothetical protein
MAERESTAAEWAVAMVAKTVEEARFVTGFLTSNGIPAEIESLHVDELPVNVGSLAEVRVRVPRERLEEAVALLARQLRDDGAGLDEAALAAPVEGEQDEK